MDSPSSQHGPEVSNRDGTAEMIAIGENQEKIHYWDAEPSWDYAFYTRAQFQVLKVFPELRRSEVMFLVCLKSILMSQAGKFVSRFALFNTMSGNRKRWSMYQGYLSGLVRSGFCQTYEYTPKKGSIVIGILPKGERVLVLFRAAIKRAISGVQRTGKKKTSHLYKEIDVFY